MTQKTDTIPFIDINGSVLSEIKLPEMIMPIISKRTGLSDSGSYYKGAGTIYICHFTNERNEREKLLAKTGIIYEENKVCYLNLVGKYGIFNFRHQPVFSDLEGGYGKKE